MRRCPVAASILHYGQGNRAHVTCMTIVTAGDGLPERLRTYARTRSVLARLHDAIVYDIVDNGAVCVRRC